MADDPGRYEADLTRVRGGSGVPWVVVWVGAAVVVVAIALAGTLLAPRGPETSIAQAAASAAPAAVAEAPGPSDRSGAVTAAALPPLDITSGASGYADAFEARRRRSVPLIVESTDFHANSGAAYYGIGGRLLRALGPTPAPSEAPAP